MKEYNTKEKTGGQINSKISNQDSLAVIYAIEQLRDPDIFNFGIEVKEFSIRCEGDSDISIANIKNKIFIEVKSSSISNKMFYDVMDKFLKENADERECFFVLAIFENLKVNKKNIIDRLKSYRSIYIDKNETQEKKESVKAEFIKDFKLEKYEKIINKFTIDSRPLFRGNKDTIAIFSRYLRLGYDFKYQKEYYIDRIYDKLILKMGELRAKRDAIDKKKIEEIIGKELVRDSLFNQISMSYGYKKIENGYIKFDENNQKIINIENGRKIVYKSIMKKWRKAYRNEIIKSLFIGTYKCPKCGHPMNGNFLGNKGISCPDCSYLPYLTIFSFCECGAYNVIKNQPEIEDSKIFHYINNYYKQEGEICKNCGKILFDDYFEQRIIFLPIPYPVEKYKEIQSIYINDKY